MNDKEIEDQVRDEIISKQFPHLLAITPKVEKGPSERKLRALRRSRAFVSEDEEKAIPQEYRVIYRVKEGEDQSFDQTVVVVTDDEGKPQFIIESK